MDYASLLGAAPLQDEQAQLDQQLQDLLLRRRARQPGKYSTGIGAALGGIGDMIAAYKSSKAEDALRAQRAGVSDKLAGVRKSYADALMGATAPVQAPPDMIAAPGMDQASQEKAQQADVMRLGGMGALTGDPQMAQFGQNMAAQASNAPKLALEQEQMRKIQQENLAGESPEASAATRILLHKYGVDLPEATPNATLRALMPIAEKGYAADQARASRLEEMRLRMGMGGGPGLLDPTALDQAAEMFSTTGKLPPGIMRGPAGAVIGRQIANRAAELHPEANLAGNQSSYKADSGAQAAQQKILDNTESWERTGKANLGVMLGVAQKLKDTGSPWLNQPVRSFMEKASGDPNQTAFRAAHATVVNEYAKILSGSQGSGSVTEGARHEAESMLPLDATWAQLSAAANILNTDAGNRISSLRQQMTNIKSRTSGRPMATPVETPAATGAAAPTHYAISPDRKSRIPLDASGKPIGPQEPNPNG